VANFFGLLGTWERKQKGGTWKSFGQGGVGSNGARTDDTHSRISTRFQATRNTVQDKRSLHPVCDGGHRKSWQISTPKSSFRVKV